VSCHAHIGADVDEICSYVKNSLFFKQKYKNSTTGSSSIFHLFFVVAKAADWAYEKD